MTRYERFCRTTEPVIDLLGYATMAIMFLLFLMGIGHTEEWTNPGDKLQHRMTQSKSDKLANPITGICKDECRFTLSDPRTCVTDTMTLVIPEMTERRLHLDKRYSPKLRRLVREIYMMPGQRGRSAFLGNAALVKAGVTRYCS